MPYDNEKDWDDAKDLFKEVTGKDKPDAGFLKHRSGLSKSLKELDALGNEVPWKTDLKKFEKSIKSFEKKADDYIKTLDKQIEKEKKKGEEKTRKNALKALKARLEKYKEIYEASLNDKQAVNEGADILEQLQRRLGKGLKVGLANSAAGLKAIKSSPTPETYNKEMKDGVRSLTTALKGFQQIKDKKAQEALKNNEEYQQSEISSYWLDKANDLTTRLTAYADGRSPEGDKTMVEDGTTKEQIMAEVKHVSEIIKEVAAEFKRIL